MSGLKFPKEETKKKKMSHPASILGSRKGRCYLCGRYTQTEEHHIFGGPNRTLSEQYGLKVDLCLECHQFGAHAYIRPGGMDELHRLGQEAFESQIGSRNSSGRYSGETGYDII